MIKKYVFMLKLVMKKIKFVIAILTYNRINHLKKLIDSILKQKVQANISIDISISNTYSTDDTNSYLEGLKKKERFHIYNIKDEVKENVLPYLVNCRNLASVIPKDADWVWWIGDDDILENEYSVQTVLDNILKSSDELTFVHACSSRKSSIKKRISKDSIINLCLKFGYHEVLGWISSIILKQNEIIKIFNKMNVNTNYQSNMSSQKKASAFNHSAAILEENHDKMGLFLDMPLVKEQESSQTAETIQNWTNANVATRYFNVIDDIYKMKEIFSINKFPKIFFRYNSCHLWDHLAHLIILKLEMQAESCKKKNEDVSDDFIVEIEEHWNKIRSIAELLNDKDSIKLIYLIYQAGMNYTNIYIKSNFNEAIGEKYLLSLRQIVLLPSY